MPNIGQMLKQEIVRLAKREAMSSMQAAKKTMSQHRKSIAELRRQVTGLTRAIALLERQATKSRASSPREESKQKLRFVSKGLVSHRSRLGLSAAQFGKLVGVSGQSVYNWEAGKSTPRADQLKRIAEIRVRLLGKNRTVHLKPDWFFRRLGACRRDESDPCE